MIYTLINALAILVGGFLGVLLKKGIPERLNKSLLKCMGLIVIYISIGLMTKGKNPLIILVSIFIGTIIGEIIDIDEKIIGISRRLEERYKNASSIMEGFLFASILFNAGGMGIIGAMDVALTGNFEILLAKSALDFVTSIILSTTKGIGVALSSLILIIYQGIFILFSSLLVGYLNPNAIVNISGVGGIIILAIGLNLALDAKIKATNMILSIFIPIIFALLSIY